MVFTLRPFGHTFALWQRALTLVQFLDSSDIVRFVSGRCRKNLPLCAASQLQCWLFELIQPRLRNWQNSHVGAQRYRAYAIRDGLSSQHSVAVNVTCIDSSSPAQHPVGFNSISSGERLRLCPTCIGLFHSFGPAISVWGGWIATMMRLGCDVCNKPWFQLVRQPTNPTKYHSTTMTHSLLLSEHQHCGSLARTRRLRVLVVSYSLSVMACWQLSFAMGPKRYLHDHNRRPHRSKQHITWFLR